MGGLGEDRRASIKAPQLPEDAPGGGGKARGASAGQLAKFEAALQMDFMKEYLKPGAQLVRPPRCLWCRRRLTGVLGRGLHQGTHLPQPRQIVELHRLQVAACGRRAGRLSWRRQRRAAAPQLPAARQRGHHARRARC